MGVIIGPAIGGYLAQVSHKNYSLSTIWISFSPFMSFIYYQPVKQYPHLFHEKSVFGRYVFGLKLNSFDSKIEWFFLLLSSWSNTMQVPIFITMSIYLIFCYLGFHKLCMAPSKYNPTLTLYVLSNLFILLLLWRVFHVLYDLFTHYMSS